MANSPEVEALLDEHRTRASLAKALLEATSTSSTALSPAAANVLAEVSRHGSLSASELVRASVSMAVAHFKAHGPKLTAQVLEAAHKRYGG